MAYAWGNNYDGPLGPGSSTGTNAPVPVPVVVSGLPTARALAAGAYHSLALAANGAIYTWGFNGYGQLGQGTFTTTPNPQPKPEATGSTAWATLGTGAIAYCALVRPASAQAFASAGLNTDGQLGDGTTTNSPRFDRLISLVPLPALPVRTAAAAGPGLVLFPNPARAQDHPAVQALGWPAGATLTACDALGRVVQTATSALLDVSQLAPGLYVVRATAPNAAPQTARLVVE